LHLHFYNIFVRVDMAPC